MTIEKQTLLETILFADVKEGGTKMNNIAIKTEFKIIFRKKLTTFLSIILPVGFYLLFTSLLDLPRRGETAVL